IRSLNVLYTYFVTAFKVNFYDALFMDNKIVSVFRKEHFNAAHRLYNAAWTDEENYAVFGKCCNPNYHGHNYELIVRLTGPVNPSTGYVYDLKLLSGIIKEEVTARFDHRNLNIDTEEFK